MTIVTIALCLVITGLIFLEGDSKGIKVLMIIISSFLIFSAFGLGYLYNNHTALIDQKSELNNGIEKIVTVYTANRDVIAQYEGKIDISSYDAYIKFDFNGRQYIYYNCFVESVSKEEK